MDLPLAPIVKAGNSNRDIDYVCGVCGRDVGRANLRAKRVVFRSIGATASDIKSRTVGWLCIVPADDGGPSCLERDEHWNLPARATAPGMKDTRLAKP